MPAPRPFAVATRSGTTPSCSHANHAPVRPKPVCTSSATKQRRRASRHQLRDPGEPARFGHDEAALTRDRLDDDARDLRRVDVRFDRTRSSRERSRCRGTDRRTAPGRSRARTDRTHFLYGVTLAVSDSAEQRAAVERLVERDDRGPAGCRARDLHRVLDRLRARVHEQRPLLVRAGRALVQLPRTPRRSPRTA